MTKKYNIIYAAPPWSYSSKELYKEKGERFNSLERIYKTMTPQEIKNLSVKDITAEDAVLFLWTTDSHLPLAIETMNAWGFDYKTIAFNWIKKTNRGKTCYNLGAWTMKSWEICLMGTKGKMLQYKKKNNVQGLVLAERTKHSKKPSVIRENIVDLFGDLPRVELFARQKTNGWDCWGNEVDSDISLED